MKLICRTVGPWPLNAYALICPETLHSVLVDPGAEPEALKAMLAGSRPVAILVTHSHPDHIGALEALRQILEVPVMAHPGEDVAQSPVAADRWLGHGEVLTVGRHRLRVCHTPGHTADQVSYAVQGDTTTIVGDTLFDGGPGKTWSVSDFEQTLQTLRHVVLPWPDETICYPGHGPGFRLGDKRDAIEQFLQKDHGDFFGDATWEMGI